MGRSEWFSSRRILTVDPAGRWTAALKTALADFPCEFVAWQPASGTELPEAARELQERLQLPGKSCSLVLYHCNPANLAFLPIWSAASRLSSLPPLVALLDSFEAESVAQLREFGCAQVHAGLHTLERLVKTVKTLNSSSVYPDSQLEDWIAANLPWNP